MDESLNPGLVKKLDRGLNHYWGEFQCYLQNKPLVSGLGIRNEGSDSTGQLFKATSDQKSDLSLLAFSRSTYCGSLLELIEQRKLGALDCMGAHYLNIKGLEISVQNPLQQTMLTSLLLNLNRILLRHRRYQSTLHASEGGNEAQAAPSGNSIRSLIKSLLSLIQS